MAFRFLLVDRDGNDLGTIQLGQHSWHEGDLIHRAPGDTLRVVDVVETNLESAGYDTALVVEAAAHADGV